LFSVFAFVMAGHSRPKGGVASLAYARPSTSSLHILFKAWMPGTRPGMTLKGENVSLAPEIRTQSER
jgi:hypothetical protein